MALLGEMRRWGVDTSLADAGLNEKQQQELSDVLESLAGKDSAPPKPVLTVRGSVPMREKEDSIVSSPAPPASAVAPVEAEKSTEGVAAAPVSTPVAEKTKKSVSTRPMPSAARLESRTLSPPSPPKGGKDGETGGRTRPGPRSRRNGRC